MRTEHIGCTGYHALCGPDVEDNIEAMKALLNDLQIIIERKNRKDGGTCPGDARK